MDDWETNVPKGRQEVFEDVDDTTEMDVQVAFQGILVDNPWMLTMKLNPSFSSMDFPFDQF